MLGAKDWIAIFQYQPLHEGLRELCAGKVHPVISIPAPPRGASQVLSIREAVLKFQYQPLHEGLPDSIVDQGIEFVFQYQPLHEGLRLCKVTSTSLAVFQYQPLHEGLPSLDTEGRATEDFNTSPSTRGFDAITQVVPVITISIPAPPRGASERL